MTTTPNAINANDSSRDGLIGTALFIAVVLAGTVLMALGFQHIGGYIPCKLCLEQRLPYYIGAPLMALTAYAGAFGAPRGALKLLMLLGAVVLAFSLFLGVKHMGVEYAWWAGPADCGAVAPGVDTGGKGILDALNTYVAPSCDTAAWRDPVLSLSFAGWNAVISLLLLVLALRALFKRA